MPPRAAPLLVRCLLHAALAACLARCAAGGRPPGGSASQGATALVGASSLLPEAPRSAAAAGAAAAAAAAVPAPRPEATAFARHVAAVAGSAGRTSAQELGAALDAATAAGPQAHAANNTIKPLVAPAADAAPGAANVAPLTGKAIAPVAGTAASGPSTSAVGGAGASTSASSSVGRPSEGAGSTAPAAPEVPEGSGGWEGDFAWGMYHSRLAAEASESTAGRWVFDRFGSSATVPRRMLRAEELLRAAVEAASPEAVQRERRAELALRFYYHAKWLAERNYASAAEWRYREASRLARETKRSVLAAHALSRLGYFLMHWRRHGEARAVLLASEKLSSKSNPLAPFLYGMLERKAAGPDVERLRAAEERILAAAKQPSEDLEGHRLGLVRDIQYWRAAETSPRRCFETPSAVNVLICLCSHLVVAAARAWPLST